MPRWLCCRSLAPAAQHPSCHLTPCMPKASSQYVMLEAAEAFYSCGLERVYLTPFLGLGWVGGGTDAPSLPVATNMAHVPGKDEDGCGTQLSPRAQQDWSVGVEDHLCSPGGHACVKETHQATGFQEKRLRCWDREVSFHLNRLFKFSWLQVSSHCCGRLRPGPKPRAQCRPASFHGPSHVQIVLYI